MGLRFLDIELALQGAYRDELPKRQHGGRQFFAPSLPVTSPMWRGAVADGGGASGREPGFPAALGKSHPDALAIEAAVTALRSFSGFTFDRDPGLLLDPHEPSHPGIRWHAIVAEATTALPATVAVHARMGTRPKWAGPRPVPYAVSGSNGKPAVVVDQVFVEVSDPDGIRHVLQGGPEDPGNALVAYRAAVASPAIRANTYAAGSYCPLAFRPAVASIITARAEYLAWRWALGELAETLAGRLSDIEPLRPSALWLPWHGDGTLHGPPPVLIAAVDETTNRRIETREAAAERRRATVRRTLRAAELAPASQSGDAR